MLEPEQVPSQNRLYQIAKNIQDPTSRSLFIFEYLTAGRVSELIRSFKKIQISEIKVQDQPFLLLENIKNEKNQKSHVKNIPIPIHKEMRFYDLAKEHLNTLEDESLLFPFSRVTAWKKIKAIVSKFKEHSKENRFMNANHYLRHCRCTHLITIYDYNEQELVRFMGWTDARPAQTYVHLRYADLAKKML